MPRRNRPHKLTVNTSYRAEPATLAAMTDLANALGWSVNTTLEHACQVLTGRTEPDAQTPLGARLEALRDKLRRADASTPETVAALLRRAEQADAEAEHLRDRLALVDAAVHA